MEIQHDNYHISYDPAAATITYSGSLRLSHQSYQPIIELLDKIAEAQPDALTIDLRQLRFLNSFGLGIIARFVMRLEKQQTTLVVRGNEAFPWQKKALRTLPRLAPSLRLQFD